MRKLGALVAAILLTVAAGAATTGGFPSRPQFQALGVGTTAPANVGEASLTANANATRSVVLTNSSNGTANGERIALVSGDASGAVWVAGSGLTSSILTSGPTGAQLVVRTLGAVPVVFGTNGTYRGEINDTGAIYAGTLTVNGASATLPSSTTAGGSLVCRADGTNCPATSSNGTFTASFDDACSTTPTVTFDYEKNGNLVTLVATAVSGFPCTGDSTSFATTGTPAPAAIRPTQAVNGAQQNQLGGFTDSGTATLGCFLIATSGNVQFLKSVSSSCAGTTWTASGNRAALAGWTASYIISNP